ncbi:MAG TPA: DsrE family protein [Chloroflexia bacterium]|nr:DsrE family protein [Chloroflexia bacterium]
MGRPGMTRLVVSITAGAVQADRALTGAELAATAAGAGIETVIFLSTEGARLSQVADAALVRTPGHPPLATVLAGFVAAGGTIWVCGSCFRRRGLQEAQLLPGARVVGGATLVEFLSQDGTTLTY